MYDTTPDNVLLKKMAASKWKEGFMCRICGHDKAYVLNDQVRKCAKCKENESVYVGTAFERMKLKPTKVQDVLGALHQNLKDVKDEIRKECKKFEEYARKHKQVNPKSRPFNKTSVSEVEIGSKHFLLSSHELARAAKVQQRTAWKFMDRIIKWAPKADTEKDIMFYSPPAVHDNFRQDLYTNFIKYMNGFSSAEEMLADMCIVRERAEEC